MYLPHKSWKEIFKLRIQCLRTLCFPWDCFGLRSLLVGDGFHPVPIFLLTRKALAAYS